MNLEPESVQLIRNLFHTHEFIDRAQREDPDKKIDVIIPVLHSNDLWRENLLSFYREIPINNLIIGDAGCIDDTISIVMNFPRVQIVNHTKISTLGASISDLISRVTSPKFAYLQSDVYLPSGWFEAMERSNEKYSWVGSPMQVVTMLDYKVDYSGTRPLAGAQLGETSAFKNLGEFIDDDFVYRQEDFVLEEFVKREGFQTGNCYETFHFHQVMRRYTTGMKMNVTSIAINLDESQKEKERVSNTQFFGLVKYCNPQRSDIRMAAYAAYNGQNTKLIPRLNLALRFANKHNQAWNTWILRFAAKSLVDRVLSRVLGGLSRYTGKILGIR